MRCRAEPTLHQYVVMETGEGASDMCEAIEERCESLCYSPHIPQDDVITTYTTKFREQHQTPQHLPLSDRFLYDASSVR